MSSNNLPIEKQFAHSTFCRQLEEIDLDAAKKLLEDLHLLYLGQQVMFSKIFKQENQKLSNELINHPPSYLESGE